MTSNIARRHLQKEAGPGLRQRPEDIVSDKVEELVKERVKKTSPRVPHRLDEIILFQSLSDADLIQIVRAAGAELERQPGAEVHHDFSHEEAKKWFLDKTLVDRSSRARPLRRALQRLRRRTP